MYYVLVNPASKSGLGREIWHELEQILKEENKDYKVIYTKGPGHAKMAVEKLTAPLLEDATLEPIRLIVLGGDGTINEALQGIACFEKVYVGYIPTGSSNDLSRDLGLTMPPTVLLRQILEDHIVRRMDVGILTYNKMSETPTRLHIDDHQTSRRFVVSSGIGFDAAVCEEVLISGSKKLLNKLKLGKLTYALIALKQLLGAKKVACDLYLDDQEAIHLDHFFFIANMLHQYEGGGFMFAPNADFMDGVIDLCVVGNLPKWKVIFALPTAYKGNHFKFKSIDAYKAKKVRIVTSTPLWVHTDGEVYHAASDVSITCEKQALQMLM